MLRIYFLLLLAATVAANLTYAPCTTTCPGPSSYLIREGNTALGHREAAYTADRKAKADTVLSAWLEVQAPSFGLGSDINSMLTVTSSTSGGGWRALLTGAGAMQAMSAREPGAGTSTAGVLQALTYSNGVSGSVWFVAN